MTTRAEPRLRVRFHRELSHLRLEVDFTAPGDGVTGLVGHSGAGKTTCLRVVAGLERVPGAQVEVNGEIWQDEAHGVFVPVHQRRIGYVFQDACLFPHLTVRANLDYGRRRRGRDAAAVDFDHAVELLGIDPLLSRSPVNLSGGERQRVAIARALLAGPKLLLLDEPLASVDAERKHEILPWIERLRDEVSLPILYVSHSLEEIARLADFVVRLDSGKVVASGPVADVLSDLETAAAWADDAGAVIEGEVAGYDADYGLLTLAFAGGNLRLAHAADSIGRRRRVHIRARDVSVSETAPGNTSILNVLRARVEEIGPAREPAHVLVRLRMGPHPLVARITRFSCDRLALTPGREIWAQIKAVALLG